MFADEVEEFNCGLKADEERGEWLKKQFGRGFKGIATRVWPGLRYVRMITTGSFKMHALLLKRKCLKGVKLLSLLHAATEGVVWWGLVKCVVG